MARAKRDQLLRLQQAWIDRRQANHIEDATTDGPYSLRAAAAYPWTEKCEDEELNLWLAEAEAECGAIASGNKPDPFQARVIALRKRLCLLAAHLGCTDPEIERKITKLVPGAVRAVIQMLGVQPDSEEVYFAFYGLEEDIPLPDDTLGHPDFQNGWPIALQPPAGIRAAFPSFHIPTLHPELMPEDAAWHWVRPLLFDGEGEMPPPWRARALRPYGRSAATALTILLKDDAALKDRYLAEQARQFMWPFFVERRERLRFYLRLYKMGCIGLDDIQRGMAEFDERESPLRAAASALKLPDPEALTPVFNRIFELLPWPDGLGPSS